MAQIKLRNVNPVVFNYNVGIGDTNPNEKLVINNGSLRFDHPNAAGGIKFKSLSNSGNKSGFTWSANNDSEIFQMLVDPDGNKTNKLTLKAGATVDCLAILQNGFVGLGDVSPNNRLHVKDGATEVAQFESTSSDLEEDDPCWIRLTNADGYSQIGSRHDTLEFAPGGTPKVYIDANGNLGLGAAASDLLHLTNGDLRLTDAYSINWDGNDILTHDGTVTSIGDSTTSSALKVSSGNLNLGGNMLQQNVANNSVIYLSGGSATNTGGSVVLYGASHASKPGYVEIRDGSGNVRIQISAEGRLNIPWSTLPAANDGLNQGDVYRNGTSLSIKD
jgi:hypothetical protein